MQGIRGECQPVEQCGGSKHHTDSDGGTMLGYHPILLWVINDIRHRPVREQTIVSIFPAFANTLIWCCTLLQCSYAIQDTNVASNYLTNTTCLAHLRRPAKARNRLE